MEIFRLGIFQSILCVVASIRRQRGFDKNAAVLWFIYSAIKAMLVCVHSWCDWYVILRSISSTCVVLLTVVAASVVVHVQ